MSNDNALQQRNYDIGMSTLHRLHNAATSWSNYAQVASTARDTAYRNYAVALNKTEKAIEARLAAQRDTKLAILGLLLAGVAPHFSTAVASVATYTRPALQKYIPTFTSVAAKSAAAISRLMDETATNLNPASRKAVAGQAKKKFVDPQFDKIKTAVTEILVPSDGTDGAYTPDAQEIPAVETLFDELYTAMARFAQKLDETLKLCEDYRDGEKADWGVNVHATAIVLANDFPLVKNIAPVKKPADLVPEFEKLYWANWLLRRDDAHWRFALEAARFWAGADSASRMQIVSRVKAGGRPRQAAGSGELRWRFEAEIFVMIQEKLNDQSILLMLEFRDQGRRGDARDERINGVYDTLRQDFADQQKIVQRLALSGFTNSILYQTVGRERLVNYPALAADIRLRLLAAKAMQALAFVKRLG